MDTKNAWQQVRPLLWLYATYLGTSLILGLSGRWGLSTLDLLWFQGADALVTLGFCVAYFAEMRPLLAVRAPELKTLSPFVGSSLGYVAVASLVFVGLAKIGVPFTSMTEAYFDENQPYWFIFLSLCVLPAFWEELAFRGVIQTRLATALNRKEALLVQAGLFSALHLSPLNFLTHFGMGVMFGWLRDRYASLYPGMLLHGCWNGLVVLSEINGLAPTS